MKNIFILLIALLSLNQTSSAQDIGIVISGSLNTFRSTGDEDYKSLLGHSYGFYLEETKGQWSFLTELIYQKKGARQELDQDDEFTVDSGFLTAKFMSNYHFGKTTGKPNSIFIGFGGYLGPRMVHTETYEINGKKNTDAEEIAVIAFDGGLQFGVGYKINKITIIARRGFGLVSIVDDKVADGKLFHREVVSLTFGVSFK